MTPGKMVSGAVSVGEHPLPCLVQGATKIVHAPARTPHTEAVHIENGVGHGKPPGKMLSAGLVKSPLIADHHEG